MKIFFINPPFKSEYGKFSRESRSPTIARSGTLYYPLWLIYAAAFCEKNGFDIKFLDAPANLLGEHESLEFIKLHGTETKLFVISTSTPSIYSDIKFAEKVKDIFSDSIIMIVGTHPSALPEETLRLSEKIDMIARKEYDYIVRDVAQSILNNEDWNKVSGITYREAGEIINNPDMDYIENLDEIPFASEFIKKHLNYKNYFFAASSYPEIQIFTGRGCPARCNYCVYPQVMHGHGYRLRSPENVVAEFEYIAENFPDVKGIVIEDDTFTAKKDRVIKICEIIIEKGLNKKIKWLCNARVNLDLETMKIMKKAGCRLIIPGIESGSQQILNNIKKGVKIEQVTEYIKNSKKAGLLVHACYMAGNNGETKETMQETLNFALKLNTDTAQFFPLQPYPGTEAYHWAKDNGYIKGDYSDYCKEDGTLNCMLSLPNLTSDELVEFCDSARKKYYLRFRYIAYRVWMGIKNPSDLKRSFKAFNTFKKYLFGKEEKK